MAADVSSCSVVVVGCVRSVWLCVVVCVCRCNCLRLDVTDVRSYPCLLFENVVDCCWLSLLVNAVCCVCY